MDTILINNKEYKIIKLLGKGKGGYSYLAMLNNKLFVIKQIHHEPCSYYNFGNKIQSEYNDYQTLLNTNIRIPQMIDIDFDNERIVKEYIEGKTILELINEKETINQYVFQVKTMQELCKNKGINIDYYPSNFVVDKNNNIFYIDYECNKYDPKWDYDNWGKQYWEKK
ncbi:MAG: AarF/UbiB family protein [Mollicutes bacterium]|uniref:AarF/UbiB family protein n=1 Tax=Methanobrevibacter boviskoreani TaxID=1348249 RepID=UPI0023A7DF8F|nr:AarF/UbiB family protein [Methanobrevibacter boviskoreani]MCI6930976.1 AarF/UbiB family protein [Methanobrevibacter boviskoreani]MCI7527753.1 AarF/UbiB family protein [Mollicutes bacterium]